MVPVQDERTVLARLSDAAGLRLRISPNAAEEVGEASVYQRTMRITVWRIVQSF
jgi:hypothetical protein